MELLEESQGVEQRPLTSAAFQRQYSILRGTLNRIRFLKNKQKIAHQNIVKQVTALSQSTENKQIQAIPTQRLPEKATRNEISILGKDLKKVRLMRAYNQKLDSTLTYRENLFHDDSKQEGSTLCPSLVRGKMSRNGGKKSLQSLIEEKSENVRRMKQQKLILQTRIEQRRSQDVLRTRENHSRVQKQRERGRLKIEENYLQHIEEIRKEKASLLERRRAKQRQELAKMKNKCAEEQTELEHWERSILTEQALKIQFESKLQQRLR